MRFHVVLAVISGLVALVVLGMVILIKVIDRIMDD